MKAFLKNNRQSARKVRLIADFVRGKHVATALTELSFMPHKAAATMRKLIMSAAANARQSHPNITDDQLFIKTVTVDKGVTYTRYRARAFGRAAPVRKECSHIRVILDTIDTPTPATNEKEKATVAPKSDVEAKNNDAVEANKAPAKKDVKEKVTN